MKQITVHRLENRQSVELPRLFCGEKRLASPPKNVRGKRFIENQRESGKKKTDAEKNKSSRQTVLYEVLRELKGAL